MRQLYIALHVEGNDGPFLSPLVGRVAQAIIRDANEVFELPPPLVVSRPSGRSQVERVTESAIEASFADVLVIHADADSRSNESALQERICPSILLILDKAEEVRLCKEAVPLIPIHSTEAWILADSQ